MHIDRLGLHKSDDLTLAIIVQFNT